MKIVIAHGHIVDPSQGIDATGNVYVEDGKISGIVIFNAASDNTGTSWHSGTGGINISQWDNARVVDATGLYVFPAFVDVHVHLREPGYEYKETILSGTRAGVRGGFGSLCCMPNTNPPNDNETVTGFILGKANSAGYCNVFPIGSITKRLEGKELSEMGLLNKAGCVAFSDDGKPVMNSQIMRKALEYSKVFGVPIVSHAEDAFLSDGGVMNEGHLSTTLGLRGIPAEAEVIMIKRDIELAALTSGRIHVAHVSTSGGVKAIREAKRDGINVTAETCPHYFNATEDAVLGYNTYAKVNPPLRNWKDVEAIKEGLADDTIDCLATDHAPHHMDDKHCEFDRAAFGISGLETALPLNLKLVDDKILSLQRLVYKMATAPSAILKLGKGTLRAGASADITVADLNREFIVEPEKFASHGKNTPFKGLRLRGMAVYTLVNGIIKYDEKDDDAFRTNV
ncbi:MAG: dihydroorotase [Nitrospirae bacterium]|nr:dihydroorotase [Nitrospirota bacterium]